MIKAVTSVCLSLIVLFFSPSANAEELLSGDTFLLAGVISLSDKTPDNDGIIIEPVAEGQWSTKKDDKFYTFGTNGKTTSGDSTCHSDSHCQTCSGTGADQCLTCPWGYQLAKVYGSGSNTTGRCIVCQTGCQTRVDWSYEQNKYIYRCVKNSNFDTDCLE